MKLEQIMSQEMDIQTQEVFEMPIRHDQKRTSPQSIAKVPQVQIKNRIQKAARERL
jgi:hypothetical protein